MWSSAMRGTRSTVLLQSDTVPANLPASGEAAPREASRFVCGEVRGGNNIVHERIELPGLRGLLEPHPSEAQTGSVLNGIAWDADAGSYLVTGKRWPEVIEIRLLDAESAADTAAAG